MVEHALGGPVRGQANRGRVPGASRALWFPAVVNRTKRWADRKLGPVSAGWQPNPPLAHAGWTMDRPSRCNGSVGKPAACSSTRADCYPARTSCASWRHRADRVCDEQGVTRDEIIEIRRSLRMTQEQLAQLLGIHALTVSKWERGLSSPTPHQEALLRAAAGAVQQRPDIGTVVAAALVGAGVGIALFQLLRAAFGSSQNASAPPAAALDASETTAAATGPASASATHNRGVPIVTTANSTSSGAARSSQYRSRQTMHANRTMPEHRPSSRRSSTRRRAR